MLDRPEFEKKQIVFLFSNQGDKLSFKNDNLVITAKDGTIKYQITCYRVFLVFVVGETSITSGLIKRAKRFDFVICLMSTSFKLYAIIGNRMEGNTILHRKQYAYTGDSLAQFIVKNKVQNQRDALCSFRNKTDSCKEAIGLLDKYVSRLEKDSLKAESLLGIEGSAARVYFPQMFSNVSWKGRKPRIKCDYVNVTLDIGNNLLFNMVDSLLQVYGFDVYCGIYHKEFYMRKSLACDLMEPMRPIIDLKVRKAINLKQCKEKDFSVYNHQWTLSYKNSASYVSFLMEEILEYKKEIFRYVQSYYRSFMKEKAADQYISFRL